MNNHLKSKQTRRLLLALPALVLPFATLLFWALGGGTRAEAQQKASGGLLMQVPDAKVHSDSTETKLTFYQRAQNDSIAQQKARQDDPNYRISGNSLLSSTGDGTLGHGYMTGGVDSHTSLAANEEQVNRQLAQLHQQINQASIPQSRQYDIASSHPSAVADVNTPQDPDMAQISQMLDKIKEIQNPGLVQQKLKQESIKHKGRVYAVSSYKKQAPLSTLEEGAALDIGNEFFEVNTASLDTTQQNAIEAVVAADQTITTGATVKFRLINDVFINGRQIPANTFVYGSASLSGERLQVTIGSIRSGNSIYPVSLSTYDIDGAEGIYIPGAITRDVAKESADQGLQGIGLTTYDPSLAAQAASAGVSAAKTLFSRKVRLVKVKLKAGYQVLLRDEKQKESEQ